MPAPRAARGGSASPSAAVQTKNTHSATQALRQSLKAHGRLIDDALEARVHATLVSAGELEVWQRWSADKLREQLVARAEALLVQRKAKGAPVPQGAPADAPEAAEPEAAVDDAAVAEAPVSDTSDTPEIIAESVELALAEGQKETETTFNVAPVLAPAPTPEAGVETIPAMGGRKLQESLRKLREEWKAADQGGAPNHALWKRFDRACNAAHKFVDAWLDKVRADAAEHRAQRLALIEDVKAWGAAHAQPEGGADWKASGSPP